MPAQYIVIQARDMIQFLEERQFRRIQLPGTHEIVFARPQRINQHTDAGELMWEMKISIRIYTGITLSGQRDKGRDAIRLSVWAMPDDGSWADGADGEPFMLGGDKRVHRVEGWRANLDERIHNWMRCIEPFCPICTAPMQLHKPKPGARQYTPFYGCIRFRNAQCKGTRQYEGK